jgi:hypothetical protein
MTGITSGVVDETEALQEGYGDIERNVSKGFMDQDLLGGDCHVFGRRNVTQRDSSPLRRLIVTGTFSTRQAHWCSLFAILVCQGV